MELGLSLGEAAMPDAGRELVLGLGVGVGERAAESGRRELGFGSSRCGSSPEPTVRLTLLPMVPGLGLPWPSSSESRGHLEASTRGFDVNRPPSSGGGYGAAEEEQDDAAGAALSSSPNNSAGSFPMDDYSGQGRGGNDSAPGAGGAGGGDRSCSRASDEDDGGSARKKLRLSKEQSAFLEESFKEHSTLNPKQKLALAKQLNLRPRQVEVWFQNRRARTKLKQTEVDCEYLKRCCETLTEENRRLQKELAELRALKTVHPFYMHLPATTLSMCPSCERVASNSAPAAASAATSSTAAPPTAPSSGGNAPAAAVAAAPDHRPSSFAALFSSARSLPLSAAPQAQPPTSS
ncbi:homeobox-leucine zipper protein HOX11 [Oryza brachyantha]|uniref:homeobox-leucine zipper protein HOX11 n=1 Tax=Oryza brachyantha TaxID=4533 RepID=UPI001ADA34E2|nr:homeobox-leucine zipper protein HOX11 [Oryza brachyantha]